MENDTLSPVGFEHRVVKTHLGSEDRFALACLLGQHGGYPANMVRHVLLVGLEHMGWTEERRIEEYAAYRLRCLANGDINKYESE